MTTGIPTPPGGWVDTVSKLVIQVGFPTVMAGVLLWWMLTRFDVVIARMEHNAGVLDAFVAEMRAQTIEIKAQTQAVTEIAKDSKALIDLHEKELREKGPTP